MWVLRVLISHKLSGNVDAAGPGTRLSFKALHYPGQCFSKDILRTIHIEITGRLGREGVVISADA